MTELSYAGIGSRETPDEIRLSMAQWATTLASAGFFLNSGGAPGADTVFADATPVRRRRIFVPWSGFEGHQKGPGVIIPSRAPTWAQALEIASQHHPAWDKLGQGVRALMARNVHQVLGEDLNTPVAFVLCWAKNPKTDSAGRIMNVAGGTGLAVRLAYARGIPVLHLTHHQPEEIMRVATECVARAERTPAPPTPAQPPSPAPSAPPAPTGRWRRQPARS